MKKGIKKYWFLASIVVVNLWTLIFYPQTGTAILGFTEKHFLNFLFMITPIFICIGLMDVWIERNAMIRILGKKSGFKGALIALLLGMITAVPLYALLPVAGMLLKKGSRISNVLIFLCASASVRIPLLLFELSSLGWRFTFTRFGLNIVVVFAIAIILERMLSKTDQKAMYENADTL